ncbi:hypothetical protein Calle1_21 [Cellulophaga phage Calle_1]|uniref:Cupin domain containing protein n=1 Tax=Cellulophaga phage Calle_1 TaxID=2745643 RepID=A0A8E5EAA9_9CAUD|nr:hypothetical protein M1M22_gp021 [Cellulophaga phage Calle_1]QQV89709.1 hypothetical protein Calle1_21 [Cellulophaga phage Calle_1]QQV89795.1 hypothetical protein Calle2_21 [Cellulophaga phage Calle_2]QQV89924.1 hypothetical protein Calle3_21 [Cellulophaga phage Calle_3]
MNTLIAKLKQKEDSLITYDVASTHTTGKRIELVSGLFTERLPSMDDTLFFRGELKAGKIVESHHHDCIEELVVYSGVLRELVTGLELKNFGRLIIPIGQCHILYAEEDCVFYAHLHKPQIK